MAQLLIVTLGPIQDFIAAARRSRDLWFGSWLLSELSKATARAMAEECGLEALVFPGILKPKELQPGSLTSVANKIVLRVPDGKDPAAVASLGERGMRDRLHQLRDEAFSNIHGPHFIRPRAEDQVEDLIEYVWVSTPERSVDGYSAAREKAESLLAARKNTRLWNPVSWGDQVPKSSIDGERESVLHEHLFDSIGEEGELTPEQARQQYGVGKTERLCGVGLLKRHGTRANSKYAHRFLSTGHLAAWPLYSRTRELADPELATAWGKYVKALENGGINLREQEIVQGDGWIHDSLFGRYDGSLLFEGRLAELFKEAENPDRRQLQDATVALAELLKKIGVPTPLPYYAILLADGDHMGKAIERQKTFEKHRELSRQLDQFAQRVRTIVERDHGGELIYSGGDDVLAFVPLHKVIGCARELAAEFQRQLAGFPIHEDEEKKEVPTLSAGIGISHFMDPMGGALKLARKAESLAKVERNSLAVIVDKRSGPPVEVVGKWKLFDVRLDAYVEMHRQDQVPDGAAYELRELARLLEGAQGAAKAGLEELVRREAERILRRKQPQHGVEQEIAEEVLKSLIADVKELPLSEVADRLIVARLLAQAAEEAEPPKIGGKP
ncbi:MAG TPA: type III-B CRISPR-associated protein Cas10/Cmr2 [Thermoanaerobaculia bacterium]|jgi:CRISPR-associated protein Cmr2|nr:type III-B CRISPR-associated protein Cas10/Cmr2 [Thermoanaerobaculia bacterium]